MRIPKGCYFASHQEEVGNLAPYLALDHLLPGRPLPPWRLEPLGVLPPPTGAVLHLILAMLQPWLMVFSPKSCSILYDSTIQDDDLTSPPLDLSAAPTSGHILGLVIIPDSSTLKADFLFSDLDLIPSRKHAHQGLPPADTSITPLSQFLRDLSPPGHQKLSLN